MTISRPRSEDILLLRQLWQTVFGDPDAFLDSFFSVAYSPDRCLCATEGDALAGMLYWLPCEKYAYIYAVATHPDHRGKGICRSLMASAHEAIARQGYEGSVLYPQEEGLRAMYRKLGYTGETRLTQRSFTAGDVPAALREISAEAYFRLRRQLLPRDAVIQGSPFRELMSQHRFYEGEGFLLAAEDRGDSLFGLELLGDPELAPGILAALGKQAGSFRSPGDGMPFAMYRGGRASYFAFPLE